MCIDGGDYVHVNRRNLRCALPGFSEQDWEENERPMAIHMGLPKIVNPTEADMGFSLKEPPESHCDGCPGAWYRCGFVRSLWRYERLLTEAGFSNNVELDRCDDALVLEAIKYLEMEHLRCRAANRDVLQS